MSAGQVERDHPYTATLDLLPEGPPAIRWESSQPIDSLDQQNIAGVRVIQQPP
jgi:hypothetical protein